jgi:glycosyltransferase involved in cell wall biosynthesis
MRILHVVHGYPPEHSGGTEQYTRLLAEEQVSGGHQVTVFYRRWAEGVGEAGRDTPAPQLRAAWNGPFTPSRRFLATFGDAYIARSLERVLKETSPDVIHVQHLMGMPAAVAGAISQLGAPTVITLHDYWWVCANAQLVTNYSQRVCGGPRGYVNCALCAIARGGLGWAWPAIPIVAPLLAWRRYLLARLLRGASRLIAPSEFVRSWYVEEGVPAERIEVVPHGVECNPGALRRGRQTQDTVRIACFGGLTWQKGVHVLVEAFSAVDGPAELWIAGDETSDDAYMARLRDLASPNVRFLGQLSREEVWEKLTKVDVLVVPSLWYETFSLIVHEAFSVGLPVIASNLGALAEAVRDGVDGLLVPPGDVEAWRAALQRAVEEPGWLAALGAGARPPLTMSEHAARLQPLYAKLVDRNHRA